MNGVPYSREAREELRKAREEGAYGPLPIGRANVSNSANEEDYFLLHRHSFSQFYLLFSVAYT